MRHKILQLISWFIVLSASHGQAAIKHDSKVISDGISCFAKIFSKNSVIMPNHCIANDQEILFQDFGTRKISHIIRNSPYTSFRSEKLAIVQFKENIFNQIELIN
ncbi:MAG: hypothetical protein NTX25_03380, partial [Proteobacteria bacterium]|nr:hypothetical protein [Pseudomonadota bacterium]